MRVSQVQYFLTSVADAGRDLLERRRGKRDTVGDIRALCEDLLSQQGEALGTALARELVQAYERLDSGARGAFFIMLRDAFATELDALNAAIEAYRQAPGPDSVLALSNAAEAPRQRLFRAINMAPGGTAAVVAMRRDLLRLLPQDASLQVVDADLTHLLSAWFNRGFLRLVRFDWHTPAYLLEKLIAYESVHEIRDWEDLHRRLEADRRCFAFFHPALPDEPLIFVEVALVNGLAGSIQPLLNAPRGDPQTADTAIFYSINNCQTGLRGISFGNLLIKQVVAELKAELPKLKTFATLSPLPGFSRWLQRIRSTEKPGEFGLSTAQWDELQRLDSDDWLAWFGNADKITALEKPLLHLCAHYLVREKRGDKPLDPVARFHLGNGAVLERINWLGDVSDKGIQQSAGLLVNYRYDLKKLVEHHEAYQNEGKIACSRAIQRLLKNK